MRGSKTYARWLRQRHQRAEEILRESHRWTAFAPSRSASSYAHLADTPFSGTLGTLGVNLFFVLSGYLITSLLMRELDRHGRIDLGAFYMRRVRRIFPAYYVYLAVIAVTSIIGVTHVDPRAFVYDVLYLRNYAFHVPVDWWTGHSWTLCIEEQFYLIWPLLLFWGWIRRGWYFAIGCIVLVPAIRLVAYVTHPHSREYIDALLPTRVDLLMFGCALAIPAVHHPALLAWLSERRAGIAALALGLATCAGLFLTLRLHGLYAFAIGYTITGAACAALILYVVRYPATNTAMLLSLPPVAWLGRISYSLYLWQEPFLTPGLNRSITGMFPVNLAAALVMAIASYYLIERRFFTAAPLRERELNAINRARTAAD